MMSGDSPPDDPEKGDVGYRKPPRATRFTKGRSGNPAVVLGGVIAKRPMRPCSGRW